MKFKKLNEWFSGLRRTIMDFHERHLESMVARLRDSAGPKAYCYSSPPWLGTLDPFLKKSALYHERIVVPDILFELIPPESLSDYNQSYPFKLMLTDSLRLTTELKPWIDGGFIEVMILPRYWSSIQPSIDKIGDGDAGDEEWRNGALIDEDNDTTGEAVIKKWIEDIRTMWSDSLIERRGGVRAFAESVAFRNPSKYCAEAILAGSPLGLAPVTESQQAHRLLGLWLRRRSLELYRAAKTSQALVDLSLEEVGFLQNIPAEKILEIRDSEEFSFKSFRKEWNSVCNEIESMPWDSRFASEARTLWNDRISSSVHAIRQDIHQLRMKLGAGIGLVALSIVSSVAQTSIPALALEIMRSVPALAGSASVLDYLDKVKETKRNSAYFLYRLGA
jgi:hypothetical protein